MFDKVCSLEQEASQGKFIYISKKFMFVFNNKAMLRNVSWKFKRAVLYDHFLIKKYFQTTMKEKHAWGYLPLSP